MARQGLPHRRHVALAVAAIGLGLALVAGAAAATRADAPTIGATETLVGLNAAASGGYEPPDVQVAAGPGYVAEMVNLAARFWRTTPGAPSQLAQTLPLSVFFRAGPSDRLTDPRIIFDSPSGRWFASISNIDTNSVMLAVSRTTDPTGAWSTYSFTASGCADQPRLGVSDALVVLAADIFSNCESNFSPLLGGELWAVNKQQLLDGAATVASWTTGPSRTYASMAPVQSLSSTATEYVVAVDNPTARAVHLLTVDGVPPAAVQLREVATPSISPLTPPPAAAQPPTGGRQPLIETNDDRILDSVWENGKLWFSANDACTPPGDGQAHACARVVELATATATVDWDTDLSVAGADLFYPAIRPDKAGNLVIVYGESSTTILPQLVAVGRTPDGTFTAPVVVAQSPGTISGERYGDYFGAARDPLHPELVWVAGETGVDAAGSRGWATAVASVEMSAVAASPPPPPAATDATPPRLRSVAVVARAGTAVRLSYKALDDGASVRAKVTVRNAKKSVVFAVTTAAGRLHLGQVYYVLWRPSKKLRGRFTWCVASVAAGKRGTQSCSAVTLR